MIPIGVDISDVIMEFSVLADKGDELSSFILDSLVDSFMFDWETRVNSDLKSTRQEYKKSMFAERIDSNNAVVGLLPSESGLAMMIEDGASSWDMKDGFSKSNKRVVKLATNKDGSVKRDKDGKTSEGGWYLTIPFRFATTEAVGESMAFSGKLPAEVQKIAKRVSPASVTMQDLPKQYQDIGINKTSGYIHKSPIYVGLQKRNIASTQNEKRSGYMNFRRVSDKSEEGSWQHPGFEAKKFMEKTVDSLDVGAIVDNAVDDFLTKLMD